MSAEAREGFILCASATHSGDSRLLRNSYPGVAIFNKTPIRCSGHEPSSMIAVISHNGVFVKCNREDCKRWTKITFSIPGIKIDLLKAGITQELMPKGYHIDLVGTTSVVEGNRGDN